MTAPVPVSRCVPLRAVAAAPCCVWLAAHLALYLLVGYGTIAAGAAMSATGDVRTDLLLVAVWGLPLQAAALTGAAAALLVLRAVASRPHRFPFRVASVGVFVLAGVLMTALLSGGDPTPLPFVLGVHGLTGLLVVRPRIPWRPTGWAGTDPAMDQHDW